MKVAPLLELLRLLALPLLFSTVLVCVWAIGKTPAAQAANAELALALLGPLAATMVASGLLLKGSDRALMLPTPLMMWLILSSPRAVPAPWPAWLLAQAGVGTVLWACWHRKRRAAHLGVAIAGIAASWLRVSEVFAN